MTSKNKSVKTPCPLCDRSCNEGSTDAKFIKSKGVCLRCAFGKSVDQIEAALLAKEKNKVLKAGKSLPIENFDFSNTKDTGVIAVVTINKNNCIESIDVAELNSTEIDKNCNCAACLHRINTDENKFKSPAFFEGYEPNDEFIRDRNASFDGGYNEEAIIKKTWQKPDGVAWITFLSNIRMGFLDMRLSDFAKKYKAKPKAEVPAPASKSKIYFEGVKNNEVVGGTRASDERRFFYITFSYFIGGKRGHRKGFISHRTFNNEMFNIHIVSKEIKKALAAKKIKSINILIEGWQEVNKNEYVQLMRGDK